MREFNTSGPIRPEDHYHIPPLQRFGADAMLGLVEGKKYFVVYAPRQTGKTTALHALRDALNARGYRAMHVNLEGVQTADDDVTRAIRATLNRLATEASDTLDDDFLSREWENCLERAGPEDALRWVLNRWSAASPQPIVLLLDEVDSLRDESLLTVLHQLRAGYERRPDKFPWSIALCGLRHPKNYAVSKASPFNIVAESFRLGDFSEAEVRDLLGQHTKETGQRFASDAIEEIWNSTGGQPWLVNALANEACFKAPGGCDRNREITMDAILAARERLIIKSPIHLEHIADRLAEERVRRVIEPMLASSEQWPHFADKEVAYVREVGLIAPTPPLRIANPIYREVIPRILTLGADDKMTHETSRFLREDGGLDVPELIEEFRRFFRENAEWWSQGFTYREAAAQVLLQAFLQRVVNAGGHIAREYGLGLGRTDLRIEWLNARERQVFALECKIRRKRDGLEEVIQRGAAQTAGYMDRSGATEGHLLVFDQDPGKSWEEKYFRRRARVRREVADTADPPRAQRTWKVVPDAAAAASGDRAVEVWGL